MAVFTVLVTVGAALSLKVSASNTSNFTQTINTGTLSVDIVDAAYSSVASPTVAMGAVDFNFSCQTSTGTFGTATEQIYIVNPDAADNGWTVSLAGSATTALWDSAGTDYDFNDPTGSGCTDGADTDSFGGQMTVDASGATLSVGNCSSCGTGNISLGTSSAFSEGVTDSITIATAAAASDDVGDWTIQGISISQEIPAEQPAASDYDIDMVLSIVAN
ncbi:hypothetical protein JW710_03655 [Candidatus Dojkabacteria bacterium]|nr:hypothetical protein [Candidatus Dojkabacteria bacterium]